MTNPNNNTVTLQFTPQSMTELQQLADASNDTVPGIIGKALALFKAAQGRMVILKHQSQTIEISSFVKQPTRAKFEPK